MASLALVATMAAGCSQPPPDATTDWNACPELDVDFAGILTEVGPPGQPSYVVAEADGRRNGTIVLHVREVTTILERSPLGCRDASTGEMQVGDRFEAIARDPIIESDPPQTLATWIVFFRP